MNNKNERSYEKSKDYIVGNILKDKIENGKKKFLVMCNKWVEEKDLSCPDLILEFENRKRLQLKRKMEETAEQCPSSKRRKNQEVIIILFIHCHINFRSHSDRFSTFFLFFLIS